MIGVLESRIWGDLLCGSSRGSGFGHPLKGQEARSYNQSRVGLRRVAAFNLQTAAGAYHVGLDTSEHHFEAYLRSMIL